MIVWAIQHIPSGAFLPQPRGRGGRGGTHVEPTHVEPPRIFTTKAAAKCALTNWLAGKVIVTHSEWDGEYDEHWHTEKVESRKADEMRVVALRYEVVE